MITFSSYWPAAACAAKCPALAGHDDVQCRSGSEEKGTFSVAAFRALRFETGIILDPFEVAVCAPAHSAFVECAAGWRL
jgi:hypothetical protein